MCQNKAGLTLVELIISIVLFGIIILAAWSVEFSGRRFFASSQKEIETINKISPAMEHMQKNISQGVGNLSNPGLKKHDTYQWIKFRVDTNNTPSNLNDDIWRAYRYDSANFLIYYHDAYPEDTWPTDGGRIIAENVVYCDFQINSDKNLVTITLRARYDTTKDADVRDNPEVSLRSQVFLRSMSIK